MKDIVRVTSRMTWRSLAVSRHASVVRARGFPVGLLPTVPVDTISLLCNDTIYLVSTLQFSVGYSDSEPVAER